MKRFLFLSWMIVLTAGSAVARRKKQRFAFGWTVKTPALLWQRSPEDRYYP